jgi:phage protein U
MYDIVFKVASLVKMFTGDTTDWVLTRIDPPEGEEIRGQYRPEDLTFDLSTEWAELKIPRRIDPATQWVSGNAETITFKTVLYAQTIKDSIDDKISILREAIRPEPELGRPPRFIFSYGKQFSNVVVRSIGGVRYDELWSDGRAKKIECQIELRVIKFPAFFTVSDPGAPPLPGKQAAMPSGGTPETLAKQKTGNAMRGVKIRQGSKTAFPAAGKNVNWDDPFDRGFTPAASWQEPTPASPALNSVVGNTATIAGKAALDTTFALRGGRGGGSYVPHELPPHWSGP